MLSAELSLTLAQERGDKREIAIARFMVALVYYQSEDNQTALPLAEQSLIEFQELHDAYWEARAYDIYDRALEGLGRLKTGERILRKLELTRKAGERNNLADALFIASIWHFAYNRIDEARKFAEEADLMWKQIGAYVNSASMTFALIAWSSGDYDRARSYYEEMRDRLGWQGEKHLRAGTIACLGKLAMEQGDLTQAQIHLEQALAIVREIGFKSAIALRLAELGNLHQLKGDTGKFKQLINESIFMKSLLNKYAKTSLLITLLDSKVIQTHVISIRLLGTFSNFEINNERPLRIMHRAFLFEDAISHARERFGNEAFESTFAEGQKMSLDEALDLVLKTVEEM
jgi:tetratricopeptide (TPR) repeat protein